MARREWKGNEEAFLRAHYAEHGMRYCAQHLGRSMNSVACRAMQLGLKRPGRSAQDPYTSTPAIDDAIRRAYQNPIRGSVQRLADMIGRPRKWVAERAAAIGARPPGRLARKWSDAELAILQEQAGRSISHVRLTLRKAGFHRTASSIIHMRNARRLDRTDSPYLRVSDIAELFGVSYSAAQSWVEKGWLHAEQEEVSDRTTRWVVHEDAVVRFVGEHTAAVSLPRLEPNKAWFIDLLLRRGAIAYAAAENDTLTQKVAALAKRGDLGRIQIAGMLDIDAQRVSVEIWRARKAGLLPAKNEQGAAA